MHLRLKSFRIEAEFEVVENAQSLSFSYDRAKMLTVDQGNVLHDIRDHHEALQMKADIGDAIEAETVEFTNFIGALLRERAEANLGREEPASGSNDEEKT